MVLIRTRLPQRGIAGKSSHSKTKVEKKQDEANHLFYLLVCFHCSLSQSCNSLHRMHSASLICKRICLPAQRNKQFLSHFNLNLSLIYTPCYSCCLWKLGLWVCIHNYPQAYHPWGAVNRVCYWGCLPCKWSEWKLPSYSTTVRKQDPFLFPYLRT